MTPIAITRIGSASGLALAIGMVSACSGGNGRGEPVNVSFDSGAATIYLRGMNVQQPASGPITINAEVDSELPDVYSLEATIDSPQDFAITLHSQAGVSHTVRLSQQALDIEFVRPTWVRSESLGFDSAELMGQWLGDRTQSGAASCVGLPERFQDLPLQYALDAVMDHLVANHGVALDLERKQQILCAQAADVPDGSGVDNPRGYDAWVALREGDLLGARPAAPASGSRFKNTCPTHVSAIDDTAPVNGTPGDTGNIQISCTGSTMDIDATCCADDDLGYSDYSLLTSGSADTHPFCTGVLVDGQQTRYAEFRFHGQASVCPESPASASTCAHNGNIDTVTPYSCSFSGFQNNSGYTFDNPIGAPPETGDGVAAWTFMRFAVRTCYVPGADQDTIVCHNRSVDTRKPATAICDEDHLADCYCE